MPLAIASIRDFTMAAQDYRREQYVTACRLKAEIEAQLHFDSQDAGKSAISPETTPESQDNWLTAVEAAKHMRVSIRTVQSWAKSGRLVAHGMGRNRRFKRSDCDRALEQSRR